MSEFIVSARKYRPASFEALLGQDTIARTLRNSIQRGQLAHAYLFCGPRGVGKTTTARIFAKMINCSNPGADMEPCGECESCLSFAEGRSYCIHELDAASNNGVEDIKGLIDQVRIPPQVGRYSVFIIDEVHMLSTQAFNAFLKTLEEPPAHAIFILATTEKHKILPTILSRCQTYDFNRISIEDMVLNLKGIAAKENINIDEESLHLIARKADGAMRDALTIFDQTVAFCGNEIRREDVVRNLNILDYEHCFALVDAFLEGNYAAALLKFDELLAKGFNALHFVSAISDHLRNLLVSRTAGLEALLDLPASLKRNYAEQAARCSVKFIYDALAITTQCESLYKSSINPRLHVEFALMRLSFLLNAAPAAAEAAAPAAIPAAAETPAAPTVAPEAAVPAPTAAPTTEAPAAEKAERAEKAESTSCSTGSSCTGGRKDGKDGGKDCRGKGSRAGSGNGEPGAQDQEERRPVHIHKEPYVQKRGHGRGKQRKEAQRSADGGGNQGAVETLRKALRRQAETGQCHTQLRARIRTGGGADRNDLPGGQRSAGQVDTRQGPVQAGSQAPGTAGLEGNKPQGGPEPGKRHIRNPVFP